MKIMFIFYALPVKSELIPIEHVRFDNNETLNRMKYQEVQRDKDR